MRRPVAKSLQWKFLALTVPLILVINAIFFVMFEMREFDLAISDLNAKQDRIMASQTIILAEPVMRKDEVQITLTLAPVLSDPDIVGAEVRDEAGREIVSFGRPLDTADPALISDQAIRVATATGFREIGQLAMAASDARIVDGLVRRLSVMAVLTLVVSVVVVVGIQLALRHTVVRPLRQLLDSMERTRRGTYARVRFESPDEIGDVIRAFNELQERQEDSEGELEEARANLERRVRERTRALDAAYQKAEAANIAKSSFLANMSHELRTPLTAVIGFADLIRRETFGALGDARYRDYADDIAKGGSHLLALINDILDLSKAEAGKLELVESVFDLADVVDRSIAMVSARADVSEIQINVPPRDALPAFRGDERKFMQILTNLLSNAVKFTLRGGTITVTLERDDEAATLAVIDTGIGIDEKDIPYLLQPFTQLESHFDRQYDGSGLGLPLTKRLIELHGGTMIVSSKPQRGTTVAARFPVERWIDLERPPLAALAD